MGGVRECGVHRRRTRTRPVIDWWTFLRLVPFAGAGGVASYQYRPGRRPGEPRPYALPRVEAIPAVAGSSDLAALFGLVGGPAARALPLPALADVRTVTWPVGW